MEKSTDKSAGAGPRAVLVPGASSFTMPAMPQSPETVAHAFVKAINERNIDKIATMMPDDHRFVDSLGVSQAFHFTGKIPHIEVPNYVSSADVCVAPFVRARNVNTLSPLKLYEYMSCGKAIVASDISAVRESLGKYDCGIVVQPGDPRELAHAIIRILEDSNLALRIGKEARQIALQFFSWRTTAEKISRVCEATVAARVRQTNREYCI